MRGPGSPFLSGGATETSIDTDRLADELATGGLCRSCGHARPHTGGRNTRTCIDPSCYCNGSVSCRGCYSVGYAAASGHEPGCPYGALKVPCGHCGHTHDHNAGPGKNVCAKSCCGCNGKVFCSGCRYGGDHALDCPYGPKGSLKSLTAYESCPDCEHRGIDHSSQGGCFCCANLTDCSRSWTGTTS